MKKNFNNYQNSVSYPILKRSAFDMGYEHMLSTDIGRMTPVHVQLYVPSDRFMHSQVTLMRAGALVTPVMNRYSITEHAYDCPYRLVWPNADDFFAEDNDGIPPVVPYINVEEVKAGDLLDYLGIPVGKYTIKALRVDALIIAAYFKVWNQYYRQEDIMEPFDFELLQDGDNTNVYRTAWANYLNAPFDWATPMPPLRRRWSPDPFTSLLPTPQKGDPVSMFLNVNATLVNNDSLSSSVRPVTGGLPGAGNITSPGTSDVIRDSNGIDLNVDVTEHTTVDADSVELPVELLRLASVLQTIQERLMVGGSRITEFIKNFFGVTPDDLRLHIPRQIGGFKQPIMISEVLQQAPLTDVSTTPLGTTGGHAISTGASSLYDVTFKDYGCVIVLMNVQPNQAVYFQGLPHHFSLDDRYDWILPQLAQLGEEPVPNKEIFIDSDPDVWQETFGYRPKYGAWRCNPNRVSGLFQTDLQDWVAPRVFANQPTLSPEFLECDASKEMFAVVDDRQPFYFHVKHNITAIRPIPKYGTPKLV